MSASSVSVNTIKSLGKQAARSYLDDGVPLNDSIEKMAMQHGLNAHHVRRVSEQANHAVHATLYDSGSTSKNVEFDLARPETVISKLGSMLKTASAGGLAPPARVTDYDAAPDLSWSRHEPEFAKTASAMQPSTPSVSSDLNSSTKSPKPKGKPVSQVVSGSSKALTPKLASTPEERAQARSMRKLASLAKEAKRLMVTSRSHADLYFETLTKQASKQMKAGDSFADIHTALALGRPETPETPGVIAKLAKALYERGELDHDDLRKAASMMADPAFISDNLGPNRVINGNLNLLKTLDQVVLKAREYERNKRTYDRICPNDQIVLRAVEL